MVGFIFISLFICSVFATDSRYNPDVDNTYHLFTRQNALIGQLLLPNNDDLLSASNYNPERKTVYLIHGFVDNVNSNHNRVLVSAFIDAADVNVIAVDWGAGAFSAMGLENSINSGISGANFINWLNNATGASLADYHVVGFSLGAVQAGVLARHVDGNIAYVTALDIANIDLNSSIAFNPSVATYTEAIHTNSEQVGFGFPVAHVDFYPGGGDNLPECEFGDNGCNHNIVFHYMARSLTTEILGQRCDTYEDARAGNCDGATLRMGGLTPKTGSTGIFYVGTDSGASSVSCPRITLSFISLIILLINLT